MGTKIFDGVWFLCYSHDHPPPHVHARFGEVEVIIDLLAEGKVVQSRRLDAVRPVHAKRSDIRKVLSVAATHVFDLQVLWKRTHGTTSERSDS